MRSITVVSNSTAVENRLLDLLGDELAIRRVWSDEWREPRVAVIEICSANPSVVVLADMEIADAEILAAEIDRRNPGVAVVVLLEDRNADSAMALMRAGARDVLAHDVSGQDLESAIRGVLQLAAERQRSMAERGSGPPRRVVVVAGPKGGTGKTTISSNLAAGAGMRYPGHVLLVDLDTQFGDVPTSFGIEPEHSIADAAKVGANERTALKVFLTVHDSGATVLAAPQDFTEASSLTDDEIKRTLAAMIEEFPLVIVDTAAGIDEASLVAMEFASDVIFVSSPDVPAIKAVKKQLDALDAIGLNGPRRHLVVNRADARVGLSVSDIEDTIGMAADFQIPGSRSFPIATNEGVPLIMGARRDKATGPLQDLVDFFAPEPVSASNNGTGPLSWLRRKDS